MISAFQYASQRQTHYSSTEIGAATGDERVLLHERLENAPQVKLFNCSSLCCTCCLSVYPDPSTATICEGC